MRAVVTIFNGNAVLEEKFCGVGIGIYTAFILTKLNCNGGQLKSGGCGEFVLFMQIAGAILGQFFVGQSFHSCLTSGSLQSLRVGGKNVRYRYKADDVGWKSEI
jgi:hypothetical protein